MADRHRSSGSSRPSKPSKTAAVVHERDSDSSSSSSGQSDDGSNSNSNSLNAFANDGSFLARFKQMQEACQQQAQSQADDAQFAAPAPQVTVKTERDADDSGAAKKRALPFVRDSPVAAATLRDACLSVTRH
ncbi:hypothetical protein HPB47_020723 [Ixodes persulcatus]|uniref:Uncharacterized protein n=1 Tax=Ixodes persulcatus TaxID=34615 RepID=A0AC60QEJ4_IXOPE|nr:hypothetical protein HPB47_020723 [Ixodes persulcatus]